MRVVFLDDAFPGHFRHLPGHLAEGGQDQVVFVTKGNAPLTIGEAAQPFPGVDEVRFRDGLRPADDTHSFLSPYVRSMITGEAAYRACQGLTASGFWPDVVYAFGGWGMPMFVRDVFPGAKAVVYCDWYYWNKRSVYDFFPGRAPSGRRAQRIHLANAATLRDLVEADAVVMTTQWQADQVPKALRPKVSVIHDGIDIDRFCPAADQSGGSSAGWSFGDVTVPPGAGLVTYVTRGMEPYRGFEPFLRAVAHLQRQDSNFHTVVAGTDGVFYSWKPPGGSSWKDYLLDRLDLDLGRLHFTGPLPLDALVGLLRASDAHVHLSAPFLPSWSLFEAMATGCVIVGSACPPVDRLVHHGVNGLLADFFQPEAIAAQLAYALQWRGQLGAMRAAARATIVEHYALGPMLERQAQLLRDLAARATAGRGS